MPLSTGNVVITAPNDNAGGASAGAVYLFNGATGALISTLIGTQPGDQIGSGGVKALSNGNYLIESPDWISGTATRAGAVTWGNGITGISGTVSAANSLVGSSTNDDVGFENAVVALPNGNYVVDSSNWANGTASSAGAVTWGNGTTGISGVVSDAISLVGTSIGDQVGDGGVVALPNGNYVVASPDWSNGSATSAGAVTWASGTTGISGTISAANSLVGTTTNDGIGNGGFVFGPGVVALTNGNYVVESPDWSNGSASSVGAATWGNGTTGTNGAISAANSLVGSSNGDQVGGEVVALPNGNYVVKSPYWSNGSATSAGAVTWGNGTTGTSGAVSTANSLVGSTGDDRVGSGVISGGPDGGPSPDIYGTGGIVTLPNSNYVVASPYWSNGSATDAGAVTWVNGNTGTSGAVSAANSLVGTTTDDYVGGGAAYHGGVVVLTNGNYVVDSPDWSNGSASHAGAATWENGSTGTSGFISAANSLVGTTTDDSVGGGVGGVVALSNGNYVVDSPDWDNGSTVGVGAVTWGNGATGISGAVSVANSLVGTTANDAVGDAAIASDAVLALPNGNYVVESVYWNNGSATSAGAVTWGNGVTGTTGSVSAANSLVGSTTNDRVGYYGVVILTNGNYVVTSLNWSNGSATDAGAVTWGNGTTGTSGTISPSNSLVGTSTNDQVGSIVALSNGNYVVSSRNWNNGSATSAGAVTWGNGATGTTGPVSAANSLVGTTTNDQVGDNLVVTLANGNYVVDSPYWSNGSATDAGAVTWGNGTTGINGVISPSNSEIGTTTNGDLQYPSVLDNVNGTFISSFSGTNDQVVVGSQAAGFLPTVTGLSVTSGPLSGGTTVTILGTFLANATAVQFGGMAVPIISSSATQVVVTSPAGSVGIVDVTVITPAGTTSTSPADQFTYAGLPVVSGVSPASGPTAGGTKVTITGSNLANATSVDFGGVEGTILSGTAIFGGQEDTYPIDTATQIEAFDPAGNPGTVDITVTTAGGTSATSSADQFTYVAPSPPPPLAEQPILIGGSPNGTVEVYTESGGTYTLQETLTPFGNISTDIRTAVGDVNGDGIPDYIFVSGPGVPFELTVLSGASGNPVLVTPIDPFLPAPPAAQSDVFTGGGFVSAGDFLDNGRDQIVVSPDQSGGPRISIYDRNGAATATSQPYTASGVNAEEINPGSGLTRINNFLSVNADLRGGARTAVGDLNGDGVPDLAIAAGYGGGPAVLVINGTQVATTSGLTASDDLVGNFFAFNSSLRDGAYLAIGDVLGNGQQDLILGPGNGGPAEVEVLSGAQLVNEGAVAAIANPVANFVPTGLGPDGSGMRVAVAPTGTGDQVNVVVGAGRNMPGLVKVYPGTSFTSGRTTEPAGGQLLNPDNSEILADGIFVG